MPVLMELNLTGGISWQDSPGHSWQDAAGHNWQDDEVLLVSTEDYAGARWWDGYVIGMTPPQYRTAERQGGYCRMGFGSVELSPALFGVSALWPPPINFLISVYYTATTEDERQHLFTGTAHRTALDRESVGYDLYGEEYDVNLLSEAMDYEGDTVPLPRAFGTVRYRKPVRLPDVNGKPTYHNAYLAGSKGIDWHVYDDGVNVDANVTDNGDGTFSLSAAPVGEVTISGTGAQTTVSGIAAWAAGRLGLSYNATRARGVSPAAAFWADSQQVITSLLSEICAFFTHLYYIRSSTLYLVDMLSDNGTVSLTEYDFFPAQYSDHPPVSLIRAEWTVRQAVEETIGKYVKDVPNETVKKSTYLYGDEMGVTPYHTTRGNIDSALTNILTVLHKPVVTVSMPLSGGVLPVPGQALTYTDESSVLPVTVSVRARNLRYDFLDETVTVEGEGAITA